jgi:hypothetical protein
MIILAVAIALLQGGVSPPRPQRVVEFGVAVRPESVTVGQHVEITARVRAPRGATIVFPPGPDSGGSVEAVDPRTVTTSPDTMAVDQTAHYVLAVWDTGVVHVALGTAVVTAGTMRREIPFDSVRVRVRSVLPADTTLRVPKPARGILQATKPWWPWLVLALLALLLLLLLWWWLRRRRRRAAPIVLDPFARAEEEFARIDALRLLDAGERGRFVALNVEVLRDYLAARVDVAPRSYTSTELLRSLAEPHAPVTERLTPVLTEADLIKFARRPVTDERARELATELRAVVHAVEDAMRPQPEEQAA